MSAYDHGGSAMRSTTRCDQDTAPAKRVLEAISRCDRLPVFDRSVQRVLTLAEREECTLGDLVHAVEQDAGLTANILRFANSAAVPTVVPVRSMRQAVTMVGRHGLRRLALDSVAYRFFERASGNGESS